MRKLLWLVMLLPVLCWGQSPEVFEDMLWEASSSYPNDPDTCTFLSDTTAADSAIFYIVMRGATGNGMGVLIEVDTSGVGVLNYADSVSVHAYPRVAIRSASNEDGSYLATLWDEGLELQTLAGAICTNWTPTYERDYFLVHPTWWQGMGIEGVTLTVKVAATDAVVVNKLSWFYEKF